MDDKIKTATQNNLTIYTMEWRGIQLKILYTVKKFGDVDHIEVLSEGRVPISITQTGYKSHFLSASHLNDYGDAVAYVQAWLDHEANCDAWRRYEAGLRQLSLF